MSKNFDFSEGLNFELNLERSRIERSFQNPFFGMNPNSRSLGRVVLEKKSKKIEFSEGHNFMYENGSMPGRLGEYAGTQWSRQSFINTLFLKTGRKVFENYYFAKSIKKFPNHLIKKT